MSYIDSNGEFISDKWNRASNGGIPLLAVSSTNKTTGIVDDDGTFIVKYLNVANGTDITTTLQALLISNPDSIINLPSGTFTISATINGVLGKRMCVWGSEEGTTTILQTHTGFGFKPSNTGGYDFRRLVFSGPATDGSYAIGSNEVASGAGRAVADEIYMSGYDICIYFGTEFEHPLGLSYDKIYCQSFRTAGVSIGGIGGAASGESAWEIGSIIATNSVPTSIESTPTVTVNTPDTTHDRLTWTGTIPLYGYLIIRSLDGSTNWALVPNIYSPIMGQTFDCLKSVGETWNYKVIRCTVGVFLGRGKAVSIGVIQGEYVGIGLYVYNCKAVAINALYSETRYATTARGCLASLFNSLSYTTIQNSWTEYGAYGVINYGGNVSYTLLLGSGLQIATVGTFDTGGGCPLSGGRAIASGGTPIAVASMSGGALEHGSTRAEYSTVTHGYTHLVDGNSESGYLVKLRGAEKARFKLNSSGYVELTADLPKFTVPSKSLTPLHVNASNYVALTNASATAVMSFNVPNNNSVGITIPFNIRVEYSGATRQSCSGIITVSAVSASGTVAANATISGIATALQAGTLTDPVVTTSVAGSTVTILVNTTTSGSTPTIRFYANQLTSNGSDVSTTIS